MLDFNMSRIFLCQLFTLSTVKTKFEDLSERHNFSRLIEICCKVLKPQYRDVSSYCYVQEDKGKSLLANSTIG